MAIAGTLKERSLTHDLLATILQALGARTERVVVNDLKDDTYFARLVLNVENEFQHKIVEIDARPSACIALATRQRAPIYVNVDVWNEVEDMTEELQKLEKKNKKVTVALHDLRKGKRLQLRSLMRSGRIKSNSL